MPPRLYLKDLSGDEFNQKILVYYSSSGSGKTAELVGSSASRGAHFSFVLSVKDLKKEIYSQFENDLTKDKHYQTRYETEELTSPGNQSNHSSSRKITDGRTYLEIDE